VKRSIIFLALLAPVIMAPDGCSADQADRAATNRQQEVYSIKQPIPTFSFSQERESVRQLYNSRNENVATYTVWRSDMGAIEGDCPSIAYPIPYDTSLTNPLKRAAGPSVIEQAEPNGLFSSKNSISTWVRCVVTVGERTYIAPVYIESKVTAYPFPVTVDYEANRVLMPADVVPTVTIKAK